MNYTIQRCLMTIFLMAIVYGSYCPTIINCEGIFLMYVYPYALLMFIFFTIFILPSYIVIM